MAAWEAMKRWISQAGGNDESGVDCLQRVQCECLKTYGFETGSADDREHRVSKMTLKLCTVSLFVVLTTSTLAAGAGRLAIADGVATEVVFLLEAQDRVVGVDETSRFPDAARELPQIGYFRRLSAEGVLSLNPDLLLAAPSAGPTVALEQIKSAGVEVVKLPEVDVLDDVAPKVLAIGAALGMTPRALDLAATIRADIRDLRANVPTWAVAPRVLFVLAIRESAPLVAGYGTTSDEIIREAGAINAASFEGFKPMSREAVIAAAPDLVLMTDEHSVALGGANSILKRPEFSLTPAGRSQRSLTLPALAVLGLGPRTPGAIRTLREALGP